MQGILYPVLHTPSPEEILPRMAETSEALYEALRLGCGYADTLQPDPTDLDPWFWSHSARFEARRRLKATSGGSWAMVPKVPNCGIHLSIDGLHTVRVVKSLKGDVPHPGGNANRRRAWTGFAVATVTEQLQFALGTDDCQSPPLSLIADWHVDDDREPVVHLSLPMGSWKYLQNPRYYWRVLLSPGGSLGIAEMPPFSGQDDGDPFAVIPVDWQSETE